MWGCKPPPLCQDCQPRKVSIYPLGTITCNGLDTADNRGELVSLPHLLVIIILSMHSAQQPPSLSITPPTLLPTPLAPPQIHTCWSSSFSACTVPNSLQASASLGLAVTAASRARAASVSTPRLHGGAGGRRLKCGASISRVCCYCSLESQGRLSEHTPPAYRYKVWMTVGQPSLLRCEDKSSLSEHTIRI